MSTPIEPKGKAYLQHRSEKRSAAVGGGVAAGCECATHVEPLCETSLSLYTIECQVQGAGCGVAHTPHRATASELLLCLQHRYVLTSVPTPMVARRMGAAAKRLESFQQYVRTLSVAFCGASLTKLVGSFILVSS